MTSPSAEQSSYSSLLYSSPIRAAHTPLLFLSLPEAGSSHRTPLLFLSQPFFSAILLPMKTCPR